MYISYARNSEEEEFVDKTLRRVLENELGYTVCIFDRDSLPGGSEWHTGAAFIPRLPPFYDIYFHMILFYITHSPRRMFISLTSRDYARAL